MRPPTIPTIETRSSWTVAFVALAVIALSYGAPWVLAVGLKDIAAEAGGARSVPSLAGSLAWLGGGVGGILMARIAEQIGARWTVVGGAVMIAFGLALSTLGPDWPIYIGYGLFAGVLGIGAINAPLYVYVSHWFDLRRGSALALISSGGYLAGALWPPIFERTIALVGWRQSMLWYGAIEIAVAIPLALYFLRPLPVVAEQTVAAGPSGQERVLGWPPNLVFGLMTVGMFLCCVPMAMPLAHLVAFCTDAGIRASDGAAMLAVLSGVAFVSRQIWGAVADRFGGLPTILIGSAFQTAAMIAFLLTQNEVGLYTVSAVFGLGFSGIIPAYMLATREFFPAAQAHWRIATLLLSSGLGMGGGSWLAGYLHDLYGFYAPGFVAGIAFNVLNLVVIGVLVARQSTQSGRLV